jgi:hypothetical protein
VEEAGDAAQSQGMDEVGGGAKWPRWLVMLAILVGAAATFYIWRSGSLTPRYDFEKETSEILAKITGGDAAAVYEDASFQFRQKHLPDTFADLARRMAATLGPFVQVRRVRDVSSVKTMGGQAVRITYDLRFEKGVAETVVSYLKEEDGQWRLLGFSVAIPEDRVDFAELLEAEEQRIKAPREVIDLLGEIMERLGKGEGLAVRAEASPPFQESVSEEAFAALLATHAAELGKFVRVVTILDSGQNSSMTQASVDALLEYKKHRTPGVFDFIKVDGEWKLLRMKIEIPEPLLPSRRPGTKDSAENLRPQ